jgi:thioredoxin
MLEFTDKNFKEEVVESEKTVLVDFWAPWCGPCKMMGPVMEEVSQEIGDEFKVGKLNVDESPKTAQEYGVMSIPSLLFFRDGKVVEQFNGVQSAEVLIKELKKLK